jgi:hypothetical protein
VNRGRVAAPTATLSMPVRGGIPVADWSPGPSGVVGVLAAGYIGNVAVRPPSTGIVAP